MRSIVISATLALACIGPAAAQHAPEAVVELFREHCTSQPALSIQVNEAARRKTLPLLRLSEMDGFGGEPLIAGKQFMSGYQVVAKGGGQVVLGIAPFRHVADKPTIACGLRWFASASASPVAALQVALGDQGVATSDGHAWALTGGWKRVVLKQDVKPNGTSFTLIAFDQ